MIPYRKALYVSLVFVVVSSCTVLNNVYVNDPNPVGKGNYEMYLGAGSGLRPVADDITTDGDIIFSGDVSMAPNFIIGSQIGIAKKLDLRAAGNFPCILGGMGIRAGLQYSLFESGPGINAAIGTDLGCVIAMDELQFLGDALPLKIKSNGAIGADIFASFSFNRNARVILTPRYSFNTIYVRKNEGYRACRKFKPYYPSLSLGIRFKKAYLEATAIYFDKAIYPNFGIVYFVSTDVE